MPSARSSASRMRVGIATVGLVVCVGAVLMMTLSPTPLDRGYESAVDALLGALHRHGVPVWFGYRKLEFTANVLMFLPLGFLIALALPRRAMWLAVLIVPALSVVIECTQWVLLAQRTPCGLDVLANTLGGLVGAVAAWLLRALVRARDRRVVAAAFAQAPGGGGGDVWPAS